MMQAQPPIDELDNLFDNDVFKDVDINMDGPSKDQATQDTVFKDTPGGLGIDEEIKITKKRRPVPKLDEDRLLSQAGIPKLRRITRERFNFKGKGFEYSDIARVLNIYQLWLDDLYPRAKFADGLAIIEKLGHTKRMQTMRKEWINEGKLQNEKSADPVGQSVPVTTMEGAAPDDAERVSREQDAQADQSLDQPSSPAAEEDLTTPKQKEDRRHSNENALDQPLFLTDDEGTDQPPFDKLDALFAADERPETDLAKGSSSPSKESRRGIAKDDFVDDMEAMADMEDGW